MNENEKLIKRTLESTEYQNPDLKDKIVKLKEQGKIVEGLTPEEINDMFREIKENGKAEFGKDGQMTKQTKKDEAQK